MINFSLWEEGKNQVRRLISVSLRKLTENRPRTRRRLSGTLTAAILGTFNSMNLEAEA